MTARMISCASWALAYITKLPVELIETVLRRQPADDGVSIAQDGSFSVDPVVAERILRLLGYETQMAAGGMTVREGAELTKQYPGSCFYFSLGRRHAAVCKDGLIYDNHYPAGIPGNEYPLADDTLKRVICMEDHAADPTSRADDVGGIARNDPSLPTAAVEDHAAP